MLTSLFWVLRQGASIVVNFGDTPFKFNLDDLLVEEEGRHNPGSKEPWRFKEKVGQHRTYRHTPP